LGKLLRLPIEYDARECVIAAYNATRIVDGSCSIRRAMDLARSMNVSFSDDDAYRWLLDLGSR